MEMIAERDIETVSQIVKLNIKMDLRSYWAGWGTTGNKTFGHGTGTVRH